MTRPGPVPTAAGRLLLIRHAQTDDNAQQLICGWTDSCLSERGRQQIARLAAHVAAGYPIERLYASPLQRAWLTAEAIAAATNVTPIPVAELREINFGAAEGLSVDEFEQRYPALYSVWGDPAADLLWPDGESRAEFWRRAVAALAPIEAESRTRCVAVVSHGGIITTYLAARFGGGPAAWGDFRVRNCSITEVSWRAGQPALVCHDLVDHLGDLVHE